MSNLKWIKGNDPRCDRGHGRYLVKIDPADEHEDPAHCMPPRTGYDPSLYYAGPLEITPPDPDYPPPTVFRFRAGPAAFAGPGLYFKRVRHSTHGPPDIKEIKFRSWMLDLLEYAGPFTLELGG